LKGRFEPLADSHEFMLKISAGCFAVVQIQEIEGLLVFEMPNNFTDVCGYASPSECYRCSYGENVLRCNFYACIL